MNHFYNNGLEILRKKRNSKPKKKNIELLYRFLKNRKNELDANDNTQHTN